MFPNRLIKLLLGISLLYCLTTHAMLNNSDNNKPLKIEADSATFDRSTGLSTYLHNVIIDQGSTHVRGEKVTPQQDKTNALEEIIIYGTASHLAYYETTLEANKPKLVAIAETIKYYPQRRSVILLKNAKITQGDNSITGEHIEYDIDKQKMRAAALTDTSGEKTRTTIVITPEKS